MKIALIGNFKCSWCSEVHFAATLEKLGNEVIRLQEDNLDLATAVEVSNQSDFMLWVRTYGMMNFDGNEMLRLIKVPTVSYHLDLYWGISRQTNLENDPFWRTDFVFSPDGNHQEDFKKMGINHFWQPPGIFEDECYIFDAPKIRDVIFVGSYADYHSEWPWRREMNDLLAQNYPTFERFPKPPDYQPIRGAELNELYCSTKVVAGDSISLPGNKTYSTDRIFETTGRGGFIIYPRIEFLEKIFGDNLVFYETGNWQDMKDKIDYYLAHDEEREKLRRAAFEITKKNHTYTVRFKHLLEVINAKIGTGSRTK